MRNRYGDEYRFESVGENTYTITGNLQYCRYGGKEGQDAVDYNDLGFIDPSGGPFITPGYIIENRKVIRIYLEENNILFDVE